MSASCKSFCKVLKSFKTQSVGNLVLTTELKTVANLHFELSC